MKLLDIGTVVAASGTPASTLRYYEELRLITSVGRHGLRRQYDADVLQRLALITLGKSAGFSLDEIAAMLGKDGKPDIPRQELLDRAEALERKSRDMAALAVMTRHVANCPAPSHLECPSFQKLLRASTKRRSGAARSEQTL